MIKSYNTTYPYFSMEPTIPSSCLPRILRATLKGRFDNLPVVERLLESFTPRTLRFLRNVDELEREVLDSSSSHGRLSVSQEEENELGNKFSDEELQRTHQLARSVHLNVPRNDMTEEFHQTCEKER